MNDEIDQQDWKQEPVRPLESRDEKVAAGRDGCQAGEGCKNGVCTESVIVLCGP